MLVQYCGDVPHGAARCSPSLLSTQVTLIYHKKLDEEWKAAANKLRVTLAEAPSSSEEAVTIIGRSHKQKMELDRDFVIETMEVAGREYIYKQVFATHEP